MEQPMEMSSNEIKALQQIARNSLIEPFEGSQHFNTIRKTRNHLENGALKLKKISTQLKSFFCKKVKPFVNNEIDYLWKNLQTQKKALNVYLKKKSSIIPENYSSYFKEIEAIGSETQKFIKKQFYQIEQKIKDADLKNHYQYVEEKAKTIAFEYLKKTFEYLLYEENAEEWMIKRTDFIFKNRNLKNFDDIQKMNFEEREVLINLLYPYDHSVLTRFAKVMDFSFNVTLGGLVASNLPATGVLVSVINIAKTIVKVAHRLHIMSAIFGQQIISPDALFQVSAQIISSLEDWESKPNHQPYNVNNIKQLYEKKDGDQNYEGFQTLLEATFKRDAYIIIPGVGMISLGKIILDDYKLDLVVRNIVADYFYHQLLQSKYDNQILTKITADFKLIYQEFMQQDYFKKMQSKVKNNLEVETSQLQLLIKTWRQISQLTNNNIFNHIKNELDQHVYNIYMLIKDCSEEQKTPQIQEQVSKVLCYEQS